MNGPPPLLRVDRLRVEALARSGPGLVEDVGFEVRQGEIVALLGPSGAGKSLTLRALAGLLPRGLEASGSVGWDGEELLGRGEPAWARVRGSGIGLVLQDAGAALDPLRTVGAQVSLVLRAHGVPRREAARRAVDLLTEVGLADAATVAARAPHALSGGERQRAQLALALAPSPRLLLADEPTASLDREAAGHVAALLRSLRDRRGLAILVVTHDAELADALADRTVHVASGRVVDAIPATPRPPPPEALAGRPRGALAVHDLAVSHGSAPPALRSLSFALPAGSALALVGPSGSGKTSTLRALAGLVPHAGRVAVDGVDLPPLRSGAPGRARCVQLVFQAAAASFDPRQTVGAALVEVLAAHGEHDGWTRAARAFRDLDLDEALLRHLPGELSGGQVQRAALARALLLDPAVLLLDEPTSALDAEASAAVLDRLDALRRRSGMSMVFVTHDPAVVRRVADHVVVLDRGELAEAGPAASVLASPAHPRTRELLGPYRPR